MPRDRTKEEPPGVERVGGLLTPEDRRRTVAMLSRAFSRAPALETHVGRAQFVGPQFDPANTRIVVAHGEVVSAVVLTPRTIRLGSAAVPAMSVGPVGTHERHRKKGYAALAMQDASWHMGERGILVAYLTGIPHFYHRFGYYPWRHRP